MEKFSHCFSQNKNFSTFLILFHTSEGCRGHPITLFEFTVKITGVQISHFFRDIVDLHIGIEDHVLRFFVLQIAQILIEGTPHFLLENLSQLGCIHMILIGENLQTQILLVIHLDITQNLPDHRCVMRVFRVEGHDHR